MRSNFQIGLIGKGSQFKRVSKILKKLRISFFLYKPDNKNYYNKKEYEQLKKCKIIFILSPNKTHYSYIKNLSKNRYIFCEKPPVNNRLDLKKIKKLNHNKIYFNFNFRYSKLANILNKKNTFKLGKLIYGNINICHGLAFKREYSKSWRADIKKCKKGVFEIVSVHWVDFLNYFFNLKKICNIKLINFTKKGNSFDNSFCKVKLKNNAEVDIFSSYSSPLIKKVTFIFSNGIVEQNENYIEIRGPAKNYDNQGHFVRPKLIKKININDEKDYNLSLEASLKYFLKIAKNKKSFPKKDFNCSLKSNELIL
tara:strand:+ start:201 stop:1130 length:930 start_codon:yes stop_codon:yes gene_type:complete